MSERGDAECSLAVLHVRRGKCLQKKEAHRARLTGLCVVAIRYIEGVPPTCDAWPSCQGRCIVCLNIPREVKNHHNKLVIKNVRVLINCMIKVTLEYLNNKYKCTDLYACTEV